MGSKLINVHVHTSEHRWKMAKKKADELGEVIVDKDGNKVSRAVLNAQLVSIMLLLLLWHVHLFIFHVPYSF